MKCGTLKLSKHKCTNTGQIINKFLLCQIPCTDTYGSKEKGSACCTNQERTDCEKKGVKAPIVISFTSCSFLYFICWHLCIKSKVSGYNNSTKSTRIITLVCHSYGLFTTAPKEFF